MKMKMVATIFALVLSINSWSENRLQLAPIDDLPMAQKSPTAKINDKTSYYHFKNNLMNKLIKMGYFDIDVNPLEYMNSLTPEEVNSLYNLAETLSPTSSKKD